MSDPKTAQRPIIQLDTQLANQIAAGEVVERPASVVKELLENSLDAGADQIDVEVLNGGKQLIRIRDNGHGIDKEQIPLALAPHATSKITSLSDLEALRSFGFRGEALASISSVSKFSLTSRTLDAEQGWRAIAEGQSMSVTLSPAPAREGTRIDVSELFYNTPARRRFLRTDKTEFAQIESVIKQVALANPELTLTLKHNQRQVRRFKAAFELEQIEQRVAQICGKDFIEHSVRVDVDYLQYRLSGWIALPSYHRSQSDGQYFYVNHRPVKDKVLSHALREAYGPLLPEGRFPAFVLFFEIPSEEVDVNVHPTKHEVRFHEVRQVHDFIVQAIEQCLHQGMQLQREEPLVTKNVDTLEHNLHSAMENQESPVQFDSYNQFIASAYRTNLAESGNQHSYQNDSISLLTQHANEWCLIRNDEQLGLLRFQDIFNYFSENAKQTPMALNYPELADIPTENIESFKSFATSIGVELSEVHGQFKIIAAPENLHNLPLSELLWDWYCFEQQLPMTKLIWLKKCIDVQKSGLTLPIKYLSMADFEGLFNDRT